MDRYVHTPFSPDVAEGLPPAASVSRPACYGEAESEEDFAYAFVEDNGLLNEVPESLRVYFDYEAYARDLFSSGYVFHEGYVFSN